MILAADVTSMCIRARPAPRLAGPAGARNCRHGAVRVALLREGDPVRPVTSADAK
jgi:hypothetical protein